MSHTEKTASKDDQAVFIVTESDVAAVEVIHSANYVQVGEWYVVPAAYDPQEWRDKADEYLSLAAEAEAIARVVHQSQQGQ